MGILHRFRKGREKIEIVSREPVAKFKVVGITYILGKQVVRGIVQAGLIYPGYKVKGSGAALLREIYAQNRKVDFAVEGDEVALLLEGRINVPDNRVLEIYHREVRV